MSTRREFLANATVTLLMIPLAACSSSSPASSPANEDGGGPPPSCNGIFSTSTNVSAHTHTLCVPASDLSNPPGGGATYASSTTIDPVNNQEHTHTVTLTLQQLTTLGGGGEVTVTASLSDFHTHDFMIMQSPV